MGHGGFDFRSIEGARDRKIDRINREADRQFGGYSTSMHSKVQISTPVRGTPGHPESPALPDRTSVPTDFEVGKEDGVWSVYWLIGSCSAGSWNKEDGREEDLGSYS